MLSNITAPAWSALAATCSAITAFLIWREQHKNLLESIRPELILADWSRESSDRGDSLFLGLIHNAGRGPALHVSINILYDLAGKAPAAVMGSVRLNIVRPGKDETVKAQVHLYWARSTRDAIAIPIEVTYFDLHGNGYRTLHRLLAFRTIRVFGGEEIVPGIVSAERYTKRLPIRRMRLRGTSTMFASRVRKRWSAFMSRIRNRVNTKRAGHFPRAGTVQKSEDQALKAVWAQIEAHVCYLNDVYNLAFKLQMAIGGIRIADIPDVARAQLMILMRITDYLRCVQLLNLKCYPEQAGTLAASIFELAHTAVYFARSPAAATQWLSARSIKEQVPRELFGTNWKELVKANAGYCGAPNSAEPEYQVYQQLCWMKHSLPKMQDMRVEEDGVSLIFGPYTDERALSHAWFSMEHAGRLTEFVMSLLLDKFGADETRAALRALAVKNTELHDMGIARFGSENPFNAAEATTAKPGQSEVK
jgi:hypothetical protein